MNLHRHRRGDEEEGEEKYVMLRQVLNLLFMIGAIAGAIVYAYRSHQLGTVIIFVAMAFKFVECIFRLIK